MHKSLKQIDAALYARKVSATVLPFVVVITQWGCTLEAAAVQGALLAGSLAAFAQHNASLPLPLEGMPEGDPEAVNRLAKESTRIVPAGGQEPLPRLVDALVQMGYTITAVDRSLGVVSFERTQLRQPDTRHGYESAVTTGTLQLTSVQEGVRFTLVLSGKINWTNPKTSRVQAIPRLSPDEHKRFFDAMLARVRA